MRIIKRGTFPIKTAQVISGPAVEDIKNGLYYNLRDDHEINAKTIDRLFDEIGIEWATKHGNWPKRLTKILKKNGFKITSDTTSKYGKIARESCLLVNGRTLTITDNFDWSPGDFGDGGSCFWGCRAGAKKMIKDHGGDALLIHDENGTAIARCWGVHNKDYYVIFNAYVISGQSTSLVTIARILSDSFNQPYYRNVDLTIDGEIEGPLWINGGKGYIIGGIETAQIEAVDLTYKIFCEICKQQCTREAYMSDDGIMVVCESCRNMGVCNSCDNRFDRNSLHTMNGQTYCDDCFYDMAFYCTRCGTETLLGDAKISEEENLYCAECYEHLFTHCKDCGCLILREEATGFGSTFYCDKCSEGRKEICAHCGESMSGKDRITRHDDAIICHDCCDKYYDECDDCFLLYQPSELQEITVGKELRIVCETCAANYNERTITA